ncbi:MAG: rab guanine nucleotide exchange factor S2 [Claussenomyces sp. TS43310]|nr:MAG: rab guanine nucleotide exchange factor S2 [Claussenomyces sp. TS43310]
MEAVEEWTRAETAFESQVLSLLIDQDGRVCHFLIHYLIESEEKSTNLVLLNNSFIPGFAVHPPPRPSSAQTVQSYSGTSKTSMAQDSLKRISRTISASSLHAASNPTRTLGSPPVSLRFRNYNDDHEKMNTIPDPRSRTTTPVNPDRPPSPSQHPDLSNELAALSTKLVNAINQQTSLDDTLNATRHELEASRSRIRQLELETQAHADQISKGIWIRASVMQSDRRKLLANLVEEKNLRTEAEKSKKKIEVELENLTAALFEEANKMVINAREEAKKEHDIVQRRNDQLKAQLEDTETLLRSHQEQLAGLKRVMGQMSANQDDQAIPSAPPTPGTSKFDSKEDVRDISEQVHPVPSSVGGISPSYPTSFTHLLTPVLRTDLASYDDFISLLRISKNASPNRVSSGSYGGLGLGLGLGSHMTPSQSSTVHQQNPSNGSTSSLGTVMTNGSSPITPTTPASTISTGSTISSAALPPLKDTRFYKRVLAEDIEPTLRLDTAPHLSWLARRAVLNAMCEGTLVVEPMPQTSTHKLYQFACSLCGETRRDENHVRTHRFRTSESDSAQRYPLCKYCLGRVRSSCDFLGFLRVVKDGHWRAEDEESEKAAWEESVRLREQMFWCRMGGGVIPQNHHHLHQMEKSPRTTTEEDREMMQSLEEELERTGEIKPRDVTPITGSGRPEDAGNSISVAKRRSDKPPPPPKDDPVEGLWNAAQDDAAPPSPVEVGREELQEEEERGEKEENITESDQPRPLDHSLEGDVQRLSITIPGAFE